jgi:hypothetical protein
MMRMEVEPQHHHDGMDQSEDKGEDGKNQNDEKEGIDDEEEQDPFMSVPVEVVFHILACLVLPAPTPSRGDRFGGPYEAAVESAVQLLRLPLVPAPSSFAFVFVLSQSDRVRCVRLR